MSFTYQAYKAIIQAEFMEEKRGEGEDPEWSKDGSSGVTHLPLFVLVSRSTPVPSFFTYTFLFLMRKTECQCCVDTAYNTGSEDFHESRPPV